ncbi:SusC/RagA family TonB-linked outer membrane protein [Flavivirga spongiicola]|uniref:TonB-dependent receptor n=1 Tax=Flavivirga spongiicola TaxID=421621 RepID=A0ABU7XVM5_9FLAO|nr:TonB-dependent receptor [Flavivirga sp. MEBiC05379]MDO5979838.1 TonB-dependent receptor [Flavivirga sp. MEBiC05379]
MEIKLKNKSLYFRKKLLLIIMRTFVFLCCITAFGFTPSDVLSQNTKIKIDIDNTLTVDEVFDLIMEQTDYKFIYQEGIFKDFPRVKVKKGIVSANKLLQKSLSSGNFNVVLSSNNTVVVKERRKQSIIKEQGIQVSGVVIDGNGQPLPGANILEKGTKNGTQSNFDGNFSLKITNDNAILVVSYLGFERQEVTIGNQTNITVVLKEDAASLDEVVVVGYGTVKKSDLTGAVGTIKEEEIQKQQVTRIDQALQGRLSGVQVSSIGGAPGSGTTIRIRGGNSINAGNEPLYVVDGFIGGGDLNTINPADIKSIEVLKDASSTAIYGSRGSNGVVLITTKRGKLNSVPQVTYDTNITISNPVKKLDLLSGREYAEFRNEYAIYNGVDPANVPFSDLNDIADTNWQDIMFTTGVVHNNNLSVTNGTETSNYYLGLNYLNDEGIIIGSGFKRYQLRFNIDQHLGNAFKIGASLTAARTNRDNRNASGYGILPTAPVYNDDGSFFSENQLNGFPFNNPLALEKLTLNETTGNRILGNIYAQVNLLKGLTFKSTFGFDLYTTKNNTYSSIDLPSNAFNNTGGIASVNTGFSTTIQNENTLNYDHTFNDDHNINVLAGYTYQNFKFEGLNAGTRGFSNDVSLFNALENGDQAQHSINSNESSWTLLSALFRVNYSYKGKYLLTLSGRNDGSSRLAEGNQWQFFPSVAIGWRLSDEAFIKDLDVFDNLKLRVSYGKSGSQSINPYATLASLQSGSTLIGGNEVTTFIPGGSANSSLGWEVTDQYNIGLEASFFNRGLNVEIDYYSKETTDLLLGRELPFQTGFGSRLENVGSLENKGIEFNINARIIRNENFNWQSTLTLASNKNKVTNLAGKDFLGNGTGSRLIVGESVGTFFGAKYLGVWQDGDAGIAGHLPGDPKFEDLDDNGIINVEDGQIIGNAIPDFYGGINNIFTYKDFTLTMFFDFSQGNDIYDLAGREFNTGFTTNVYGKYRNRWTPQNTGSNIPRAGSNFTNFFDSYAQQSDLVVSDGSYLRLKTLNLQYDIPLESKILKSLAVYATGTNLFTLTKYDGFTPDVNSAGTSATRRGFDSNVYPQSRSFTLGLRATF